MMKKCLSLVLTLCMILTLCIVQPVAYAQADDAMVEIFAKLSDFQKGSTVSLESDGYIGIPVDVSMYYDSEAHGKAVPGYNKTPVILYVVNTNTTRIGTDSDESIIKSMLDRGYVVAVADYKNNPQAVSPGLEYSAQKIRTKLSNGEFFADENVFGKGVYVENHVVPAGYNITLSDVYFELDKHGVNGDLEKFVEAWNYDFRAYWKDKSVKWVYEDGTRKATQNGFDGSTPVWYQDAACSVVDNENGQYIKVGHTLAKSIFDLVKPDGTPIDFNLYMHIIYPVNPENDVPVMTIASSSSHLASSYAMENRPYLVGYSFNGYAVAAFDFGYTPMARDDHYSHFDSVLTNSNNFCSASKELYQPAAMRYLRYLSLNNHDTYSFDINKIGVYGNSKGGFQTYLGHPMFVKHQYSSETENVGKEELENLVEKKLVDFGANSGLVALDPENMVTAAGGEGTHMVFPAGTRYSNGHIESETQHGMTVDGGAMQPWLTYTENGVTKEISSGVQMVYSSCGGTPEYMCEGHSPIFSASNFYDSFGSGYTTHNYIANKMRTENIPSLFFETALGHDTVSGKDMIHGVDTYNALFRFTDYYLKDTPADVVYTSPANGDAKAETTSDIMIKFYGPVSSEEIEKVTVSDGADVVPGTWNSGYGNTEWTFTPDSHLEGNTDYTVTVPAGLKGDNGKETGADYTVSFTTADENYIISEAEKVNVTSENGMNIELEVPDYANYGEDRLKLRFKVANDAANVVEIYENSGEKALVGSINLKGAGYYDYDITDYIKDKTAGDKVTLTVIAKKAAEDKVVYKQDFANAGKTYIDREGSAGYVTDVDGEAVTAVRLTNGLHLWKNYGYVYYHTVKLTDSNVINNGNEVTAEDYGRKFKMSVRYKDTASRYLNLSYNNCTDGNTYVFDYDYMMKSKKTTPGQWDEISVDYTSYEADYGVESMVKTMKLEIPPVSVGEMPIYLDSITVTEHVSDVDIDSVYLVGAVAESTSLENKIPEEYSDKQKYPFVAFVGGRFVGAATHYCDNDADLQNDAIGLARRHLLGESKSDVTMNLYLRRDYDVTSANGDAWHGNYGQIGGNLVIDLGGYNLNAQIGLFNSVAKHGWDAGLGINSLYDSSTVVKNGTITVKESVIYHSTMAAGIDQYENIRNTNFTFENVKFVLASNCNVNPIVSSANEVTSKNHANLSVTLNNCEFDLSNVSKAITIFNLDDAADKLRCDIKMNGGKIISDSLDGITFAKLNSSGTDSLTMGKYSGEYPELVISSGVPFGDMFTTTEDGELQFIKHGVSGEQTVYHLGVKPLYGEIPAEYADAEKYPFAAFIDGEFVGAATHYCDNNTSVADGALDIAYKYLVGESKANTTLRILLRRDYDIIAANGDEYFRNYGQLGGNIIIDLDGHHLNAQMGMFNLSVKHGWDSTLKVNSLYDAKATVINGTVTVKENLINHSIMAAGTDQYENIRNSYFNFENVNFVLAEGSSANPFVAAAGTATSVKHANLYVTFDNCNFDLSNCSKAITLFAVNDSANKHYCHIRVNGGKITAGNVSLITFAKLNPEGTDSFVFGKYEGAYPELVVASGKVPADAFKNVDGEEMYFTKYSSTDTQTVYRLSGKTAYGVIPAEYDDIQKYPFVAFIDGEFVGAATHYSDKDVNTADSVVDIAYKNLVGETKANVTLNVLLRRDYEISSANGDAYSGIQGLIGGHMVLDLDGHHLNAQMGMFSLGVRHGWDSTLKVNSLYDAYSTVKNGTITVKDSNLTHTTVASGIDQYEKIRNTYVTYENIRFITAEKCSGIPFVQSSTDAPSVNPANLYVTYTNCEFDLTGTTNSMTLFNVNDGKDKYHGHIRVNGGKILAKNLNSVKISALNESGNDSFTFGKYDGAYTELVFSAGSVTEDAFAADGNGTSYFGKYSSDGVLTVYHLGELTDLGVVPYDTKVEFTVAEDGKSANAMLLGGYPGEYDNSVIVAAVYDSPEKLAGVTMAYVKNNTITLNLGELKSGQTIKYMLLRSTSDIKPLKPYITYAAN